MPESVPEQFLGFQHDSMDWKKYMRYRPTYPQRVYDTVYAHHSANGGAYDSALDIGAGAGIVAGEIGKKFKHVTLTDPSAEYVSAGKSYLASAVPNGSFDFLQTKAESLSPSILPNGEQVDLVTAGTCLHWTDPEVAIPAIASILKPNGTFAAWLYGTCPVFDRGEDFSSISQIYYGMWDKMFALVPSNSIFDYAIAATVSRYDHVAFPPSTWTSVRRIHNNRNVPFGNTAPFTLPSLVTEDESVEDFDDDNMLTSELDYEWIEGFLWSLMPNVDFHKVLGAELAKLKVEMGGRKVGVRWPFVLVLATRK